MITLISDGLVWYEYKGDEIAWNGWNYLSLGEPSRRFNSLYDMDKYWIELTTLASGEK